jgi:hypothetical protein
LTIKPQASNYSNEYPIINTSEYDLAVTGDVFRWMVDFADETALFQVNILNIFHFFFFERFNLHISTYHVFLDAD